METPSFIEDHISQIPALQLLMKMGYQYLSPDEALEARNGRYGNVILEQVLKAQLQKLNSIDYKSKEFPFSEANINAAVMELRDLPVQNGFMAANQACYDLITLGKSLDQTVLGDKKSFSFRYIDWKNPENNVFHITEEFSVLRSGRNDQYRPDIVLFINGIPMVIIECKSPQIKNPVDKAIEQQLRNQQDDGIRNLYNYSNIVFSLAVNDAKYATTASPKEFWSIWKEVFRTNEQERDYLGQLETLKNAPLPSNDRIAIFKERYKSVLSYFDRLEDHDQQITEQDKLLYALCRKDRILELIFKFILYDDGIKKIARYQQYYAVKNTLVKISTLHPTLNGIGQYRSGGVIWHTQGSGKSLTMVMLAEQIAMQTEIKNPKIILVTDRIDLDDQITETFKKCHVSVKNATKGTSVESIKRANGDAMDEKEMDGLKRDTSLLGLLLSDEECVITSVINKFESAVSQMPAGLNSPNIFVMVDEGHRSQYGPMNIKMRRAFPNACFIAFTGTPLMKKEKNTANKFGGIIDVYSITDAVADKAVVPLLYEGRHNMIEVNEKPLDTFFEKVSEPLTEYGKAALKRKFSTKSQLNKADQVIYARAWDISEHFEDNIQGITFGTLKAKGQLVAPSKTIAIKYREYLKEIGRVSCEVLISAPDVRENYEDAFEENEEVNLKFWKAMMDKYGTKENYEKTVINAFKKQDDPEIIIVVSKLLTGFDAPNNCVLYLTKHMQDHTLLQAIARVNRVAEGKEYGLIIDYYGNLENLDKALNDYSGLEDFDEEELQGTVTKLVNELENLPQAHSEVWDIFKNIQNKYDEPAYEELLVDPAYRYLFYDKLSVFSRLLKLAMSSYEFMTITPEKQIDKYKKDAKFFLALRVSVKRRYSDEIDYAEYESQVQKLIDKHISTQGEVLKITSLENIFDPKEREAEVEKLTSKAAKADHIASRTIKAINVQMNEDPVYYKKLSQLLQDAIYDYHRQRISEAEFLKKAKGYEDNFLNGKRDNVPNEISENKVAIAFYNLAGSIFENDLKKQSSRDQINLDIAKNIDAIIRASVFENGNLLVDWQNNKDVEGKIKIDIDDFLFDLKIKYGIELPFAHIDELVEECIKVAKIKYQ